MPSARQAATLQDGGGRRPAYNLRTLCRALEYAHAALPTYGLQRALFDGAAMAFLTQLAPGSAGVMERLLCAHLLGGARSAKVGCTGCAAAEGCFASSLVAGTDLSSIHPQIVLAVCTPAHEKQRETSWSAERPI